MLANIRKRVGVLIQENVILRNTYGSIKIFLCTYGLYLWPKETLRIMWSHQGRQESPVSPTTYIPVDRSVERLFEDILPQLDKNSRILEIGCNVGRSLNYLHQRGYRDLSGIEIGAEAIALMRETFPEVYRDSTIMVGDATQKIKELKSGAYDLVFCHSVLVNIHPKHNHIFEEMTRVSRRFVLTLENEGSFRAYPRDFRVVFERLGWKMVMFKIWRSGCEIFPQPYMDEDINANNTIRLFVKDVSGKGSDGGT